MRSAERETADFYQSLADNDAREVQFSKFQKLTMKFGLPNIYFSVQIDPSHQTPSSFQNRIIMTRDDDGWWDEYREQRYHLLDPFYAIAGKTRGAFSYAMPSNMTAAQTRFLNYAKKRRQMNGFGITQASRCGRLVGFSATGGAELPEKTDIYAILGPLEVFKTYLLGQVEADRLIELGISDLEIKRLHLLCDGHSARSIAQITGCSEHAVNMCFARLREKLHASTNVQLTVNAFRLGLIS